MLTLRRRAEADKEKGGEASDYRRRLNLILDSEVGLMSKLPLSSSPALYMISEKVQAIYLSDENGCFPALAQAAWKFRS